MNVELLAPGADLVSSIADRVTDRAAGSASMDDTLVLLPGKRIGHFLRRELARRVASAFAPPRIATLGELVDELFDRWNGGASRWPDPSTRWRCCTTCRPPPTGRSAASTS